MHRVERYQRGLVAATALLVAVALTAIVLNAPAPTVLAAAGVAFATALLALVWPNKTEDRDLIAEVSHEMRTPLTGILGTLELLTDSTIPLEPSEADELLVAAHGEAHQLLRIVGNLHARSRLDRATLSPDTVPTNLRNLVARAVARTPRVAARCHISSRGPATGLGDPQLIMQIATNLVQNIERYAPEGDVHIEFTRSGDDLEVSFEDSGPGLPVGDAEQVFEIPASKEGLGLGLSLSRQLARAMGGDLTCENSSSGGAVFALRIPASDVFVPEEEPLDFLPEEGYEAHSPRARLLVDLAEALNATSLGRVVAGIGRIYQELLGATGAMLFIPRRDGSFHAACCNAERTEVPTGSARDVERVLVTGSALKIDDMINSGWSLSDEMAGHAALLLPVHDGHQVVAVLAVDWKSPDLIPAGAAVSVAAALAELTAPAIARTALARDIVFERRLRASVMNELPIAVSIFAGDPPQVIDWNSKERQLLGIDDDTARPDDLAASQRLFDVRFADGTPLTVDNAPVTEVIRTGKAKGPFILRMTRADGSQVHTRTYCAPFFDDDGDVAGAVVTSEPLDLGPSPSSRSANWG